MNNCQKFNMSLNARLTSLEENAISVMSWGLTFACVFGVHKGTTSDSRSEFAKLVSLVKEHSIGRVDTSCSVETALAPISLRTENGGQLNSPVRRRLIRPRWLGDGHFPERGRFSGFPPARFSWFSDVWLPPFTTILIHFLAFYTVSWSSAFLGCHLRSRPLFLLWTYPKINYIQPRPFRWRLDQVKPRPAYF